MGLKSWIAQKIANRVIGNKIKTLKKEKPMAWYLQKTTWAAIAGIFTGIGMIVNGEVKEGIVLVVVSLQQLFQRMAISKVDNKVNGK